MNLEFSAFFNHDKKHKKLKKPDKLHANFNDVTNRKEKTEFLDNIFCKECKTPVFANIEREPDRENSCAKCGRDLTKTLQEAKDLQAKLREENERNIKYVPPERYI
jgi:hypothetical protein